jgi:hypothetical protein
MFTGSNGNSPYYLFDANASSNTCENIISNIRNKNCSIYMDFFSDENLMIKSGFYWFEPGAGRWTSGKSEIMIPTIEQKSGILQVVASASRPPGLADAHVDVYLNEALIGNFSAGKEFAASTFRLDSSMMSKPFSVITFNSTTWVPDEWIKNGDKREIGIRFSSIEFITDDLNKTIY